MCAEFTNFICTKGYIDDTAEYLPRLLAWVGEKIFFDKQIREIIWFKTIQKTLDLEVV